MIPRCTDCGGPLRQAFPQSIQYVTCGRCGHVAITPVMSVLIDVCDEENLVSEAADKGCVAVATATMGRQMIPEYRVTGPITTLIPLLRHWGYPEEGDYTVVAPEPVDTTATDYEHGEWELKVTK